MRLGLSQWAVDAIAVILVTGLVWTFVFDRSAMAVENTTKAVIGEIYKVTGTSDED